MVQALPHHPIDPFKLLIRRLRCEARAFNGGRQLFSRDFAFLNCHNGVAVFKRDICINDTGEVFQCNLHFIDTRPSRHAADCQCDCISCGFGFFRRIRFETGGFDRFGQLLGCYFPFRNLDNGVAVFERNVSTNDTIDFCQCILHFGDAGTSRHAADSERYLLCGNRPACFGATRFEARFFDRIGELSVRDLAFCNLDNCVVTCQRDIGVEDAGDFVQCDLHFVDARRSRHPTDSECDRLPLNRYGNKRLEQFAGFDIENSDFSVEPACGDLFSIRVKCKREHADAVPLHL
jgi:hypothetical protein